MWGCFEGILLCCRPYQPKGRCPQNRCSHWWSSTWHGGHVRHCIVKKLVGSRISSIVRIWWRTMQLVKRNVSFQLRAHLLCEARVIYVWYMCMSILYLIFLISFLNNILNSKWKQNCEVHSTSINHQTSILPLAWYISNTDHLVYFLGGG